MPESRIKFDEEKAEQLRESACSDSYVIIEDLLLQLARLQQTPVLNYDVVNGNPAQLAYLKARLDGANKLVREFQQFMQGLRKA